MIKAVGVKNGKKVEVVYDNEQFTFNGKSDWMLEEDIRYAMSLGHPIGGTFYPEDENDPRNIFNVLANWFFDVTVIPETDEDLPTIPYEEGFVY